MKAFFAAIRFLTIIPVPAGWTGGRRELAAGVVFFPAVGLIVGIVAAALAAGLGQVLPAGPASVLVVFALLAASGGLHMDGLSDTADGFLSSRPRGRILEIMRDSRTGAMGVMAIVVVLLLKVSCLTCLMSAVRWRAVLLVPVAGRSTLTLMMVMLPYARQDGLARVFYERRPVLPALVALLFSAVVGWWALQYAGLVCVGGAAAVAVLFALYCRRKIGGSTGDTLGAACELSECAVLVASAVCWHLGWGFSLPLGT